MTDYLEFLRSKIEVAPVSGFDVNAYPVLPDLRRLK